MKNEDDLARAWHGDEPKARLKPKRPTKGKGNGKGKERAGSESDEDESDEDEDEEDEDGAATGYPPTKEEEAESRRVAEVCVSPSAQCKCMFCVSRAACARL